MKPLLITIAAALILTGCAGTQLSESLNCENARKIYTAYLATSMLRDVSEQEIEDAKSAGAFLAVWCGWETPGAVPGAKSVRLMDRNGVPILSAP